MAHRIAKINANGRIHDDDSNDIFGGDEEEAYSFSKNIVLRIGGISKTYENSKTVDGEVRLVLKLDLQADSKGIITVSGLAYLQADSKGIITVSRALGRSELEYGSVGCN